MAKDLCIRETYEQNGQEKVKWNKIGVMFTGKNGKEYAKLNHIPNTLISVFEQRKKEETPAADVDWMDEENA